MAKEQRGTARFPVRRGDQGRKSYVPKTEELRWVREKGGWGFPPRVIGRRCLASATELQIVVK